MAFDDEALFHAAVATFYALSPLTFLACLFITVPYGGRHSGGAAAAGWGFPIPAPLAWFLMESPTLWLTSLIAPIGRHRYHPIAVTTVFLYLLHYFHRTVIYPIRLAFFSGSAAASKVGFPFGVALMGFAFNFLNAYVQTRSATHYADYPPDGNWRATARAASGAALFFWGMWVNAKSDWALTRLKADGGGGYKVPRGGWFEVVSCPNYMGEAAEWLGFAVLTWTPAAFAFFVYTCANLAPRARAHRRWYIDKFGDEFPKSRKAIFPYLY